MTGIALPAIDSDAGSLLIIYSHLRPDPWSIDSPSTSESLLAVVAAVDFLSPYSARDLLIVEDSDKRLRSSASSIEFPFVNKTLRYCLHTSATWS